MAFAPIPFAGPAPTAAQALAVHELGHVVLGWQRGLYLTRPFSRVWVDPAANIGAVEQAHAHHTVVADARALTVAGDGMKDRARRWRYQADGEAVLLRHLDALLAGYVTTELVLWPTRQPGPHQCGARVDYALCLQAAATFYDVRLDSAAGLVADRVATLMQEIRDPAAGLWAAVYHLAGPLAERRRLTFSECRTVLSTIPVQGDPTHGH